MAARRKFKKTASEAGLQRKHARQARPLPWPSPSQSERYQYTRLAQHQQRVQPNNMVNGKNPGWRANNAKEERCQLNSIMCAGTTGLRASSWRNVGGESPKQAMAHSWNTDCSRWLVNSQSLGAVDETRDTPLSNKSRLTRMDG
ncbi:predicted protein [Histoplasma capsulatum var. duboisii H88]|uniref:Predicted protein n=2 Tax=Ajellomyces capsulatus TaxID=5037 RepID=F0UIJ4_AJEC8|nr:predicted protein [Histoplasma capsulatum H143]EGC45599.1 predicted protein [Histoplasma capsulatum var. duboisii H88]